MPAESSAAYATPIAIIGMGNRFPGGANDPESYWRLLAEGVDAISEMPSTRGAMDELFAAAGDVRGARAVPRGGFLAHIEDFDAEFFRISPREALEMDPRQRLLLEVAWEAFERGGLPPDSLAGSNTGTFVGITSAADYAKFRRSRASVSELNIYMHTGNAGSVAVGRISYALGLRGPCMAVDTACSSSLMAVHLACQSLRTGECELAIAGGVNIILTPETYVILTNAGVLAPDGRCKTFDASANGYVRGEGCGLVVLKRLDDAIADGDRILAVIRGSATNQDGGGPGLTAPNCRAQERVMQAALRDAGVPPRSVQYVEAHGTGTAIGDPVEARSVGKIYGSDRPDGDSVFIGSGKTNIGHLEAASGVAGLVKSVLMLQRGVIPAHLHLDTPNPEIPWHRFPIRVPTERSPWPTCDGPRRVAVNAFGIGGSNVHLVVEEAPRHEHADVDGSPSRAQHLVTLTARSPEALHAAAGALRGHIERRDDASSVADLAYSTNTTRSHFRHRLAVSAHTVSDLRDRLDEVADRGVPAIAESPPKLDDVQRIAFLFTGQGAQYADMGHGLFVAEPVFREAICECEALLRGRLARPLTSVMFRQMAETPEDRRLLDETLYTQTALFSLEYALAKLWRSWGIEPALVLGHSLGEYVAAHVAGVIGLRDALQLVATRGQLMQALPGDGAMASVFAAEEDVAGLLRGYEREVSIAAINGPAHVVVSGRRSRVEEIVERLGARGIETRWIKTSRAFHSPLVEPMLDELAAVVSSVPLAEPKTPIVSNVTGRIVQRGEMTRPTYWTEQARAPVRFWESVRSLEVAGCSTTLEIGPHPVLTGMGEACVSGVGPLRVISLRRGADDCSTMLGSLGRLYTHGADVRWHGVAGRQRGRTVDLPTYPFQRRRHWPREQRPRSPSVRPVDDAPLPGAQWAYEMMWVPRSRPLAPATMHTTGTWILLADGGGAGQRLEGLLRGSGANVIVVRPSGHGSAVAEDVQIVDPTDANALGAIMKAVADGPSGPLLGVVHMWALDVPRAAENALEAVEDSLLDVSTSATALCKAMARRSDRSRAAPRLWLVTRGAQTADGDTGSTSVEQSALWGLGRIVALEHPRMFGALIDLEGGSADVDGVEHLLRELIDPDGEQQIVLRGEARHVARLRQCDPDSGSAQPPRLRNDRAYLITGGLGDLGLAVAQWLVEHGARHLVLMGRTPLPERESWDDVSLDERTRDRIRAVERMERAGATVHVTCADVSDAARVSAFLEDYGDRGHVPICGVIHAAGVGDERPIVELDRQSLADVIRPKLLGAWVLHRCFEGKDLDAFVLFSSVAALVGMHGQGNYAAANAGLDALAHHRRAQGLPALSINWGPWADIGMAARKGFATKRALAPDQALSLLGRHLDDSRAQICFTPNTPGELESMLPTGSRLLEEAEPGTALASDTAPTAADEILAAPRDQRGALMAEVLRRGLAEILMVDDPRRIRLDASWGELGVDSLMMVQLSLQVERDLGISIYMRELLDHPTLESLSALLVRELQAIEESSSTAKGPTGASLVPGPRYHPSKERNADGDELRPAVFVLCCPRSGSSLLRVMLEGHPDLFSPPELHLLNHISMKGRAKELERERRLALQEGLQRAVAELWSLNADESRELVAAWTDQDLPIREVYRRLQQAAAPRVLVDKTPAYAREPRALHEAERMFDGARYILLIRHPYSVIESLVRLRVTPGIHAPERYGFGETLWTKSNTVLMDFKAQVDPNRITVVRYEDLVTDTHRVMRALCDFIGVPFDPAVLTPYDGTRMTDGLVGGVPIGAMDQRMFQFDAIEPSRAHAWRDVRLPRPLGERARAMASRLGYELPIESIGPPARDEP